MDPKLYEVAKSGDSDRLKAIISGNGEDLFHQTTPKKNNILHVAAQYKQVNVIDYLLRFPSGPSLLWESNCKGDTPLHVATKVGSRNAVQVFVDLAKSLSWVTEEGQDNACRGLLRKPNMRGNTTLHHAVRGGHREVVKLLIEEDTELCNITNASDESPLYLAAHRRLSDIIKLILDGSPSSSSHKGPKGLTALHAAVHFFSLPDCREILEKRPQVIKEGDDLGWTPLHYAACFGNVEAVRLLLEHDNSVAYDLDKEGESALHIAAFQGHVEVIRELVASRPDAWDMMNIKGQTALHAAVIGGQEEAVEYMLGVSNLEDLYNEEDTDGNTALHLAVLHRRYKIVLILAKDSRVNRFATNKDHLTALDILFTRKEAHRTGPNVYRAMRGSHGFPVIQDWAKECVKKRLGNQNFEGQPAGSVITGSNTPNPVGNQIIEGQPGGSVITGSNTPNQGNSDSSIGGIINLNLLVAPFIATATFAAAFAMPGGYSSDGPNHGMATLAGRAAFKVFVVSNTAAFFFSTAALFIQYDTFALSYRDKVRSTKKAASFIYLAMLGMALAFVSGTYVVLTRNIGLAIVPCVVLGCLGILYIDSVALDPSSHLGMDHIDPDYYCPTALRDYGILRRPFMAVFRRFGSLTLDTDHGITESLLIAVLSMIKRLWAPLINDWTAVRERSPLLWLVPRARDPLPS